MSDPKKIEPPPHYTAPKLTVIGSLHEVTLAPKASGPSDGVFFSGGLTNTSP